MGTHRTDDLSARLNAAVEEYGRLADELDRAKGLRQAAADLAQDIMDMMEERGVEEWGCGEVVVARRDRQRTEPLKKAVLEDELKKSFGEVDVERVMTSVNSRRATETASKLVIRGVGKKDRPVRPDRQGPRVRRGRGGGEQDPESLA
jgi:K+-sensing histidine kinase KdpD